MVVGACSSVTLEIICLRCFSILRFLLFALSVLAFFFGGNCAYSGFGGVLPTSSSQGKTNPLDLQVVCYTFWYLGDRVPLVVIGLNLALVESYQRVLHKKKLTLLMCKPSDTLELVTMMDAVA